VRDGKDIKIRGMWAVGQGGPNGKFVLNYGFDRTQFDKDLNFFPKSQGGPQQFPAITEETPRSTMSVDPGMGVYINKSGFSDFEEGAPILAHSHRVDIGADANLKAPKDEGKADLDFKGPKMGGGADFELKGPQYEYEVELGADANINGPKGGGGGKADLVFNGPNLGYGVEIDISGPNVNRDLGINLGGEPHGNLDGMLTVKLTAAKMTYDAGTFGKMHPYTTVIVGSQNQKSKPHKSGGKNPVWNETFHFRIQGETTVDFEVYDKEMVMSDD
jgi:hypothetical protein